MQAPSQTQTATESKDRFFVYFRHEVTALQEQMDRLNSIAPGGGERNDAVDHCLAGIDRLSHEVKDASSYIPAYDQRTYSEAVKALSEKLQTIRATFNPPKKFAFKTRSKNASAISISDAAELAASQRLRAPVISSTTSTTTSSSFAPTPLDRLSPGERLEQEAALSLQQQPQPQPQPQQPPAAPTDTHTLTTAPSPLTFPPTTTLTLSSHTSLTYTLPASSLLPSPTGTLLNLSHCTIDLSPPTLTTPFSALYLRNLSHSTITTGLVRGATHITALSHCTLYVATRQFRMHDARDVTVYLHCGSRPVIEGCEGVRFARLEEEMLPEGVRGEQNLWSEVDDFGWLRAGRSPNWRVLGEEEDNAQGGT